jgi:tetratricopeptide (TPR) repeat protein
MTHPALEAGVRALRAGDRARARELFQRAAQLEPRQVEAWLWLAEVAGDDRERLDCFERVLAIEPNHLQARSEAMALRARLAPATAAAARSGRLTRAPMALLLGLIYVAVGAFGLYGVAALVTGGQPLALVMTPTPEVVLAASRTGGVDWQLLEWRERGTILIAADAPPGGAQPLGDLSARGRWIEISLRVRNGDPYGYGWALFAPRLHDRSGAPAEPVPEAQPWVAEAFRYLDTMVIKPGDNRVIRLYYDLPAARAPSYLAVRSGAWRGFGVMNSYDGTLAFPRVP